jgi:ribonuclease HII
MKVPFPTFLHEEVLWQKDFLVVGIDEVGRGAFAGPLTVGAVVFDPYMNLQKRNLLENYGIHDSKKLTPQKRQILAPTIISDALYTSVTNIPISTINAVGIGKSMEIGVRKLVKEISLKFTNRSLFLLIDAFRIKNVKRVGLKHQKAILFGDSISISIAAASIIAKVHRDSLMQQLSQQYPSYLWETNKGYGTYDHREALSLYGPCKEHRKDFIRSTLMQKTLSQITTKL